MRYAVKRLEKEEWSDWSEMAHSQVFGVLRPNDLNRCDFALISQHDGDPIGFAQCHEIDSKTLYLQSGGALEHAKKSPVVFAGYVSVIDWCTERYDRLITRIANDNLTMIKFALKAGFLIIGTSTFKGKVTLEMELNRSLQCL